MSWFRVTLSPAECAAGEIQHRTKDFYEAFSLAGAPRMMAMFQRERLDGGLNLFFTPECGEYVARLIEEWGGVPCDPPTMAGLHLLVGHNEITYYLT